MLENSLYLFSGSIFLFCVLLMRNLLKIGKDNKDLSLSNKDLKDKLQRDIDSTLDLATSEQLIRELRIRKNTPFILLLPIKEKDYNGITIESHGINQASCFAMLHLAKAITAQNFKKNGVEPPRLPPLSDYFE